MTTLRRSAMLLVALALLMVAVPNGATASAPSVDPDCAHPVLETAGPVGTGSCPGIRPGTRIIIPSENAGCTANFVYLDPKASRWYIATAGHCVMDDGKQGMWAEGKGPVVTDGNRKPFGRFVFASHQGNYDIGLILISKGITPKASVCHFGGPTGMSTSRATSPTILEHYGNSPFADAGLPARTGIALAMPDPYRIYSVLPSFKGDSGGPVIDGANGKALGYVTELGFGAGIAGLMPYAGPIIITRLGPQMAYAQKFIKKSLVLRTAPHARSSLAVL